MIRFAVLLLLLVPGLACAQVYKCRDKDGRTIYVQTKPAGADCSGSVSTPPPSSSSEGGDPLRGIAAQADERQAAESQAREQAAQQQAQREARCAQWRARLAALERASKVFTVDEKGERQYRSDAQNDAMRDEARAGVAADCG
ncbi:MAG: DUF4124 domain-containing protein [Gammaproteobacteria bacterium]